MTMAGFDALIVSDFRFPGGTSNAIAHEIRALSGADYSVGLVQIDSAIWRSPPPWHQDLKDLVESGAAVVVDPAERLSCSLLFLHNPLVFKSAPKSRFRIEAGLRVMVAHHPPCDARGHLNYDPWRTDRIARGYFGGEFVWAPISPACRASFQRAGATLPLLKEDWTNLLFVDDWGHEREAPRSNRPVIGRHSRPQAEKWPASRAKVLEVYPDDPAVDVRLLGVGKDLRRLVSPMPKNWTTFGFNEVDTKEFLHSIDFFVYFHHPNLVEAFGRCPAEAAASGAVVILPPHFRDTFAEAAVYCEPHQAMATVTKLFKDNDKYRAQSAQGRTVIDGLYGPERFLARIHRLLYTTKKQSAVLSDIADYPVSDVASGLVLRRRLRLRAFEMAKLSRRRAKDLLHKIGSKALVAGDG
jgi:hypothetical protein